MRSARCPTRPGRPFQYSIRDAITQPPFSCLPKGRNFQYSIRGAKRVAEVGDQVDEVHPHFQYSIRDAEMSGIEEAEEEITEAFNTLLEMPYLLE